MGRTSIDLERERRMVSQYVDHSETVDSKIPNPLHEAFGVMLCCILVSQ